MVGELLGQISSQGLFWELGLILTAATLLAYVARLSKQPHIPAYILAGLLLGPLGLGLVRDESIILALSEMGIAFLLFIVGLEIDLKRLRSVKSISLFGGSIQVALTFAFGYLLGAWLGFSPLNAVYIGLVLAFSSTMIVVKLLSDKDRLDTLHGRIILGILLVQDLLAILALSFLTTFDQIGPSVILSSLLKGGVLFALAIVLSKFLMPSVFRFAAKSQELLFLSAVSFCFLFSLLAFSLGFSIIIGAFLAGVSLASLPYNFDIIGQVRSLKDFFATIFFVSLGMQLVLVSTALLVPFLLFFLAVTVIKPLILLVVTSLWGYEKRTAFLTSISLGQVSEFSLVLATLGVYSFQHISREFFSMIVLLTVATISLTSYVMQYENWLYAWLATLLTPFERLAVARRKGHGTLRKKHHPVILFGHHRMGDIFFRTFDRLYDGVLVVDHNPDVIEHLSMRKVPCMYGDATNAEILEKARVQKADLVVSTIPNEADNAHLIKYVKGINKKAFLVVTANQVPQALELYKMGADYVILPHLLGGKRVARMLGQQTRNRAQWAKVRSEHLNELQRVQNFLGSRQG